MGTKEEILSLEERFRQGELGPDSAIFEELLADDVVLTSQDGQVITKAKVIEAHRPGKAPKFTRVDMSEMVVRDYGQAAVVTCKGYYEGPHWTGTLRFVRVWLQRDGRWCVIAAWVTSG